MNDNNDSNVLTIDWPAALSAAKQIIQTTRWEADFERIINDPATHPALVRAMRVALTIPGLRGGGIKSTRALMKHRRRGSGRGPRW